MRSRRLALFLAFALSGAAARANPELEPAAPQLDGDQTSLQALTTGDSTPLAGVRASLQALKGSSGLPPAKSRALLAALSKSAAKLKFTGEPAAALERLKEAVSAAASAPAAPADRKSSPDLLTQVTKRGDEFLASLPASPSSGNSGVVANALPPNGVARQLPGDVSQRALGVLSGSPFGAAAGPGSFDSAANGNLPSVPRAVLTPTRTGPVEKSDLGIAVPGTSRGGPTPRSLFQERFNAEAYRPAALQAIDRIKEYAAVRPPGMPPLTSVATMSRNLAQQSLALVGSMNKMLADVAPPVAKVKNAASPVSTAPVPRLVVARPVSTLPPPHIVVGTTGGFTSGKYHMATGRIEVEAASLDVTAGNIGRPDIRYGLNAGDLKVWVSHRQAGDLMKAKTAFGASAALDSNTRLNGSVTLADTSKGPSATFMLGITGALVALAP